MSAIETKTRRSPRPVPRARRGGLSGRVGAARPRALAAISARFTAAGRALRGAAAEEEGQGTTEYAILVGVLVVIAIAAIIAFRGNVQTLWTSIQDSINGL